MKVFMLNSANDACCYPRILLPAYHNGFLTDKRGRANSSGDAQKYLAEMLKPLKEADIVVMHRPENKEYKFLFDVIKANGQKIVIDNDDTFKIKDNHPLAVWTSEASKVELESRDSYFDEMAKDADLLTTSTEFLAKEYRKINDNVVVLPNCIDTLDWDEPLRNEGDKVRIGIVGSVSYAYDYAHIKDILIELSDRKDIQLVMFGFGDKKHRIENPKVTEFFKDEYGFWDSLNIEHIPWCKSSEYPQKLNEARLDFMLIPRRENYFNKCKSNIKFLEASMCEIPVIAQSFDDAPYEEITPDMGFLVRDNTKWRDAINILIDNKDLRRSMGKKAKEYVLNNYNIEQHAHKWEDAYRTICEK